MTSKQRFQWATAAILISLVLAYATFYRGLKTGQLEFWSEFALDILGLVSASFAFLAAYLLYPLRKQIGGGIFFAAALLIALLVGFEFGFGIVWLTADKLLRYRQ